MRANSLEAVYKLHMKDLYHYLLQLTGHPQLAEDLVQDTFVKAYEHLESYRGEEIRPWLFRVAHNTFVDRYRKEKRQVQTDPLIIANLNKQTQPGPEEDYLLREKLNNWLKALHSLPPVSRQVILLRDYHDFTYREITDILGLSLTNVKVTLFRARQKMREVMNADGL
ncbi:MAG: RNA polymerase subunit sigma [Firmicutes bacterium HGW-Firmicutes-14]|nr:MAG: RNA polymerase subunit sigma [Firmicutes bacterium HGW-Firmicutes-14]